MIGAALFAQKRLHAGGIGDEAFVAEELLQAGECVGWVGHLSLHLILGGRAGKGFSGSRRGGAGR